MGKTLTFNGQTVEKVYYEVKDTDHFLRKLYLTDTNGTNVLCYDYPIEFYYTCENSTSMGSHTWFELNNDSGTTVKSSTLNGSSISQTNPYSFYPGGKLYLYPNDGSLGGSPQIFITTYKSDGSSSTSTVSGTSTQTYDITNDIKKIRLHGYTARSGLGWVTRIEFDKYLI